ncbi:peroxisomal membrane protein PMP34-like [Acanthaster planci]|uniref:Peroxisomal membrane protein PMP34-like n=1 Tax=Acanthaster planci TaxID=133434 RepID=A0A8B7ZGM9_ACAPL|nr:peroxisomal membrane protein PMP34-like [Acanthaster planci]
MSGAQASLFSYQTLVHAIAGAAGSIAAMTLFYPLETARTRLQIDDKREARYTPHIIAEIVREEGVFSLYRGWFPVISSLCCSNFVYFYAFNGLKAACLDHMKGTVAIKELLIGVVAGVINVLVTTPMWVVNMRLKLQGANFQTEQKQKSKHPHYSGIFDAFRTIIQDEGLAAMWNGMSSSLLLVLNPAIHFMVYEAFKRFISQYTGNQEHSSVVYFVLGAVSKVIATLLTYPLQLVQAKQRYDKEESESHRKLKSMWSVLSYIVRNQGPLGLYKGLEAKLLQTVLTAAMMFAIYEKIAAIIFQLMKAEKSDEKSP